MGNIYAMGSNKFGQIGLGPTVKKRGNPTLIPFSKTNSVWNMGVGAHHTILFTSNKEIFTFGKNKNGQLGSGDRINKFFPSKITVSEDEIRAISLSGGMNFTALVTDEGQVFTWGCNDKGQLGLGSVKLNEISPSQIQGLRAISKVVCGHKHIVFMNRMGEIFACGKNEDNELGIDGDNKVRTPVRINIGFRAKDIFASNFSAILSTDLNLYVWGQTPLGFFTVPEMIKDQTGISNVGLLQDGLVLQNGQNGFYSIGVNDKGQLGLNDQETRMELTPIESLMGKEIKCIASGKSFCIMLTNLIQEMINLSKAFSENRPVPPEEDHTPLDPIPDPTDGEEEGEEESVYEPDEYILKRLISFFELTRRDYINLFQKLIYKQPDLLDKINLKMLQIIMAKEFKIEEILKEIDYDLSGNSIEEYFLDPYAYNKRVKVDNVVEDGELKNHITRDFSLTKSLSNLLVAADRHSAMALKSEELEIIRKNKNTLNKITLSTEVEFNEENLTTLMKEVEESSQQIEEKIEVLTRYS